MVTAAFLALAVTLTLLSLSAALWPLWRQSRRTLLSGVLLLGLAGAALYQIVGAPAALRVAAPAPRTLDEAITQLRQALHRDPNRLDGWLLLAQALSGQGRFGEARDAYAQALALAPDQPEILVASAQARMQATTDRRLDPQAVALLEHALALQPSQQRARWLLGVAARQAGQPERAAQLWQPLLAQVDADTRTRLREQIELARRESGLAPTESRPGLTITVTLAPSLSARKDLDADADVFVIARLPGASSPPVAIQRHHLRELPLTVTLDDSDLSIPRQKFSTLNEVEVLARLSRHGDAGGRRGDLESTPVRVALPASAPLRLRIEHSRP